MIDRVRAWCAWLPWISRSVWTIRRPCWRAAWRQWKYSSITCSSFIIIIIILLQVNIMIIIKEDCLTNHGPYLSFMSWIRTALAWVLQGCKWVQWKSDIKRSDMTHCFLWSQWNKLLCVVLLYITDTVETRYKDIWYNKISDTVEPRYNEVGYNKILL